jgi:hypothetical protein
LVLLVRDSPSTNDQDDHDRESVFGGTAACNA